MKLAQMRKRLDGLFVKDYRATQSRTALLQDRLSILSFDQFGQTGMSVLLIMP